MTLRRSLVTLWAMALAAALAVATSPVSAEDETAQAATLDEQPDRPLTDAELMALPPFERSHAIIQEKPHLECALLQAGRPPVTIRQLLIEFRGFMPIEKAFKHMRDMNKWEEGEVSLDTFIVYERCFTF